MSEFTTEQELAEQLDMPLAKVEKLRRQKKWPHLRFGRFEIRYTPEQIAEIKRIHLVAPDSDEPPRLPGQTALSARRAS